MKKSLIVVPTAVAIGIAGIGVAAAVGTDSAAVPTVEPQPAVLPKAELKQQKEELKQQQEAQRIKRVAKLAGISKKNVEKYKITKSEAKQIREATNWASQGIVESVRQCESSGNYATNTGNGYYGAYQFDAGTWLSVGGDRYAPYASGAPPFAQDHMAWTLWSRAGWGPWGCA